MMILVKCWCLKVFFSHISPFCKLSSFIPWVPPIRSSIPPPLQFSSQYDARTHNGQRDGTLSINMQTFTASHFRFDASFEVSLCLVFSGLENISGLTSRGIKIPPIPEVRVDPDLALWCLGLGASSHFNLTHRPSL